MAIMMRVAILATLASAMAIPVFDAIPFAQMFKGAEDASTTQAPWLARWLGLGGEGDVLVTLPNTSIVLPHRPASFPTYLTQPLAFPVGGDLVDVEGLGKSSRGNPHQACFPPPPFPRWTPPSAPYTIVLIERGACNFAEKVLYAQLRGAAGVIVGDNKAYAEETDEEGRERRGLLTMFSPGSETDDVHIPSVFVSRSSYLLLRDLLRDGIQSHVHPGLWVELGEPKNEGGTLGNLLSFALLMPSFFLVVTMMIHRIRNARQRRLDRAPATVVLSLPERVWQPDMVWDGEKSSTTSDNGSPGPTTLSKRPPESDAERAADTELSTQPLASSSRDTTQYYSRDECAICMDNFQPGDVIRILPCGHVFHKVECDAWLLKWRRLCPTCRADVTLPARAMTGSTITPVMVDTALPDADETGEPLWHRSWVSIQDRTSRGWIWVRGLVRRQRLGERELLVPGPSTDEV